MGKVTNIRNHAGIPVKIMGEKYNMLLTMLGNDYLEDHFGTPSAALIKYGEMVNRINKTGIDKESREVLIQFIYASILHNAYDINGKIVRYVPTAFEIKSSIGQNELLELLQSMTNAQNVSFPDPVEQEEKEGNFQR